MEDRSGLFNEISAFSQRKLKKVETKVVTGLGDNVIEKRGAKGLTKAAPPSSSPSSNGPNKKLDLQVGLILPGLMIGNVEEFISLLKAILLPFTFSLIPCDPELYGNRSSFFFVSFFKPKASHDVATHKQTIDEYGITHILNLAGDEIENYFEDDYNYSTQNISDDSSTCLKDFFEDCFDFLDEGRHRGNCLIHCNASKPGLSRSTSICIAYLMVKEKKRLEEAFNEVKEARSFVRPSDAFMKQLKSLDEELFGANKKDDIEDAFTKKKRQEIEAEKAMLKTGVKLKERVKIFGDAVTPEALSPSVTPLPPVSAGSLRNKWNPEPGDSRRSSAVDDLPAQGKKLTSVISLFNKPREEQVNGTVKNFTPSSTPVKKWKTVEPPPRPGFCKNNIKRNKSRKFASNNTSTDSSIQRNKSRGSFKRMNTKENSIDSVVDSVAPVAPAVTSSTSSTGPKPLLSRQQSKQKQESLVSNGVSSGKTSSSVPAPPPPPPPTLFTSSKKDVSVKEPPKIEPVKLTSEDLRRRKLSNDKSIESPSVSGRYSNTDPKKEINGTQKTSIKDDPEVINYRTTVTISPAKTGSASKEREVPITICPASVPPPPPPAPTRTVFGKVQPPPMKITGTQLSIDTKSRSNPSATTTKQQESEVSQVPKVPERKDSINVKIEPQPKVSPVTQPAKKDENNNKSVLKNVVIQKPVEKNIVIQKPVEKSVESDSEEEEIETESEEEDDDDDGGDFTQIYDHRRPSEIKGLNRSSTMEILQLIRSKTGADLAQHANLTDIDEEEEIENLLAGLETEGIDNVDWNELGIDLGEVKNIVEKHEEDPQEDKDDDDESCEYTEEEEEVTADEEEEEEEVACSLPSPSKWRTKV